MSTRPYGLTEEDQSRLYQTHLPLHLHLHLLQLFSAAEPARFASAYSLLGERLALGLFSADQKSSRRT